MVTGGGWRPMLALRNEEALLNEGAKLVLYRNGNAQHFFRFLVPQNGIATFMTPLLALGDDDMERLDTEAKYRWQSGNLTVMVEHQKVIVVLATGDRVVWGPRHNLTTALKNICR